MSMLVAIGLLLVSCHQCDGQLTWGNTGHQIVAQIAQTMLTPTALSNVRRLITDGNMSAVATWADDVRRSAQYSWSAPLHFINTPDWLCQYSKPRDCRNDLCCDGAIQNFTSRLHDHRLSQDHRTEALKFLIHFVGDIHQPLHVAFTSDLGGNNIDVIFNNAKTNLHSLWDSGMIYWRIDHDFGRENSKWRDSILKRIATEWASLVPSWKSCSTSPFGACSTDWAVESLTSACRSAYVNENGQKIVKGDHLGMPYYNHVIGVVEQQIAKAGVRLANVINLVLG